MCTSCCCCRGQLFGSWEPQGEGELGWQASIERGARMVPRCGSGVGPRMGAQKVALGARPLAPSPWTRCEESGQGGVKARNLPSFNVA